MTARILIVEDESAIRDLIAMNLEQSGHRPLGVASAEEAMEAIRAELPDLVLLDWMLPGESGIALAQRLRRDPRTRPVPIIMLSARGAEEDKLRGLDTGADDYLTKPFSVRELQARIKAVLRRRAPHIVDEPVDFEGLVLDPARHRVNAGGREIAIGPTEFRLLHFLITHPERVYTRAQLLDAVWGDHVALEERTVDVHIRRLRAVLEPTGHDRLVQTVRGSGYRFARE